MTNDIKNKGDITPFVIIFLGFVQQAVDNLNIVLANKIEQIQFYHNGILQVVEEEKTKDVMFILMQNSLFGEEGMTVEEIAEILEVSVPTVRNYKERSIRTSFFFYLTMCI